MKCFIANALRSAIIFAQAGAESAASHKVARLENSQLDMTMHLLRTAHLVRASILISCIINENSNEIISRLERVMRSTRSAQERDPPLHMHIDVLEYIYL
jgi:hypothetical protein